MKTKKTENKLVPALRFPEFEEDGEWEEKRLGEVATFSKGKGIAKADISNEGNLECIRYGELYTRYSEVIKEVKSKTHLTRDNLVLSEKNDVLIPASGETQIDIATASCILKDGVAIGSDLNIIKSPMDGVFLAYYLNNAKKTDIARLSQGISVIHLYGNQLKKLRLLIPSPPEQQKIADCLRSIDQLMGAHEARLERLKNHKKGLMQQLFPQEGEKVPRLRFDEFKGDGEWEEKELGSIAKVTTGNKDTKNKVDNGQYPFFVRSQNVERIDSYSFDGEAILTSGDGVGVGKNFHYIIGKFDFHQRVYAIYDFTKGVLGKYLFMYFSRYFYDRVMKMSAKNSVDSVRKAMITEMPIMLPSLKEQQKIADCLSSLDTLIATEAQKIGALGKHKKGLMQQLFPEINR